MKRKANILFIITKSQSGGAQKWVKEQIEICEKEFNCFLSTDSDGWLSKNVKVKNRYLNNLILKRFSIKFLLGLIEFCTCNNIEIIVASSANAGVYARLIKLFRIDIKIIYVSHGWSSIYNGGRFIHIFTFMEKILSLLSDSILCVSKQDYNNAKEIIKIDNSKLKLISNKVYPLKKYSKNNLVDRKIKLLVVSRLTFPKRIDLLMDSIKDLDVELHIIGDGNYKNNLEKRKEKNVFFHGEIEGFDEFYKYNIFCLISDSEGLPLSALEAMSAGLPLVLSNVGGCSELIKNNGSLVSNSPDSIKIGIVECINNMKNFSEQSLLFFDSSYNLYKMKNDYIFYYKGILNE